MARYSVGIDIGKSGAIVCIDSETNQIDVDLMPVLGKELDIRKLSEMLKVYKDLDHFICFEDLNAIYGSSAGATFEFGQVYGALQGICASLGLTHKKIHSKIWQAKAFQGIREIRKPGAEGRRGKLDTKPMSLLASKQLFPNVSLLRTPRCKNDDHNISDALLIAWYTKQTYK